MTPTALKVWLQNANHPTMPNIMIRGQELRNLTAYILSLKDQGSVPDCDLRSADWQGHERST